MQSVENAELFYEPAHVYVSVIACPSAHLGAILGAAAERDLSEVIVGPESLDWLYHPYDGGVDVIARSSEERDCLRAQFAEWLSPRPDGLEPLGVCFRTLGQPNAISPGSSARCPTRAPARKGKRGWHRHRAR